MLPRLTLAAAFDTLPVVGLLLELDGTILAANRRAGGGLVGTSVLTLAPELRWRQLVAAAVADGTASDETRFEPGGRAMQLVLALADVDSRPIVQLIALDVTDRTRERLESLGGVVGGVAHEFNNLLVGVLAEASAARETSLSPPVQDALRRIEGAARRMAQLTRQLLAFSGRAQLLMIALDPDALVDELRDQLARAVTAELHVTIAAPGTVVEADPTLLRQVVLDLVLNASDAGARRIDVLTTLGDGTWQLAVVDDGDGIEPAVLYRIFEPFYSTKPGRQGLGLASVHGIVRRMGGEIAVESSPGAGARFTVRLPIRVGATPTRTVGGTRPALARMRVLVADDEPTVRATVRRLLERRGAAVVVVADGVEAEARLRAEPFDLVILDIRMPGRTGHEVLAVAREVQPGTPAILMSGYTESRGDVPPDAFLEKPFTSADLDAAITSVLSAPTA